MSTTEGLVSAFAIQTKRRKSSENTPVKSKRTRSSMSQSDTSTSTPQKLTLSPRVSLEDISAAHKSPPQKGKSGLTANKFSSKENAPGKKKKLKKNKKNHSSLTDEKTVSPNCSAELKATPPTLKSKENLQGNVTKLSMDETSSDAEIIVDQLSEDGDSDYSAYNSSMKSTCVSPDKIQSNGRGKNNEDNSSYASDVEKQLNIILKNPVVQNQPENSCKTLKNEKAGKTPENPRKSLNVAEKVKDYEKKQKSGGFEVNALPSTSKSCENKARTPEQSAKNSGKLGKTPEKKLMNDINPIEDANRLFSWLINPMPTPDFFKKNWERAPLHVIRKNPTYYKNLLSTPQIDEILRNNRILFTKNIDITSYTDGERQTHNPEGRADASIVWDYYLNGCSVRMLNPQTYVPTLHQLNATLQELFGCFVGANFYLTPPGTQGFAPHYDDIEAFILQIEGKKRWRLYKPRSPEEFLPRESSNNFKQSEIGEPILDVILNAGDMLYFPRGTIHQATTLEDHHSLHITLSVYQKNSWGDLLEKLLPDALQTTINTDSEFRQGLPLNLTRNLEEGKRGEMVEKIKNMLHKVVNNMDIVKAIDEMAKKHIHDFLPPVLAPCESKCSIVEGAERMTENGVIVNRVNIEPDTRIRLVRSHAVRLANEDDGIWRIYYSTENSNEYHEYELQFVEVDESHVAAIQMIIRKYPEYVRVDDLPIEDEEVKMCVVRDLWEKCIIVTEQPLAKLF